MSRFWERHGIFNNRTLSWFSEKAFLQTHNIALAPRTTTVYILDRRSVKFRHSGYHVHSRGSNMRNDRNLIGLRYLLSVCQTCWLSNLPFDLVNQDLPTRPYDTIALPES